MQAADGGGAAARGGGVRAGGLLATACRMRRAPGACCCATTPPASCSSASGRRRRRSGQKHVLTSADAELGARRAPARGALRGRQSHAMVKMAAAPRRGARVAVQARRTMCLCYASHARGDAWLPESCACMGNLTLPYATVPYPSGCRHRRAPAHDAGAAGAAAVRVRERRRRALRRQQRCGGRGGQGAPRGGIPRVRPARPSHVGVRPPRAGSPRRRLRQRAALGAPGANGVGGGSRVRVRGGGCGPERWRAGARGVERRGAGRRRCGAVARGPRFPGSVRYDRCGCMSQRQVTTSCRTLSARVKALEL